MLIHLIHASLRWFGKKKHVDFHNLSSKSANSDFPFTLYVLARHVQVRVARAIVRCPGGSRSQVLQDAGLPTLSWRRREHCLFLLWKLVNGIGPPALLNVLPATAASRSSSVLRSSHSYALQFPLCLSSRRKSSFLCNTFPIWNKFSSSVISCSSVSSFQCSLRKAFAADKFAYGLTWVWYSSPLL